MKTCKFGGGPLANAAQIAKVLEIIRADKERRCIVVSAPGIASPTDQKITDLLYTLVNPPCETTRREAAATIISRYQAIINGLGLKIAFRLWFNEAIESLKHIKADRRKDFLASRGEYWMAQILAEALGYRFVDATSFVVFDGNGIFDLNESKKWARATSLKRKLAEAEGIVVPGFYGTSIRYGGVITFPRDGSDISGAAVAFCIDADIYENWKDVSGVMMADPRIVENPRKIDALTFPELRELAYMGAKVLHDEAILPARMGNIPINVRNTNEPDDKGTLISCKIDNDTRVPGSLIGIAGKKGFSVIRLEKAGMNNEVGFLRSTCQIMENHGINVEHVPGGIDTLSVIVANKDFEASRKSVIEKIGLACKPDLITVEVMALICVAIHDMVETPGVAARLCQSLSNAKINIRMINQGASAISIIIGVNEKDYEEAVRAIYKDFTS